VKLLNPLPAKLCVECPVVLQWVVFLKTRPFVKQNNAEFTIVRSFTSLLVFHTSFILSCRILLLALPTSNNFVQFVFAEIPKQSAWGSCLGPLRAGCLSGHCSSSELGLVVFWTSDTRDLSTRCRKLLNFIFCVVFSVLYAKNVLSSAQFSRYNTNFSTIWQFSSKLSNNWGTGLPFLHPLRIYCTGKQCKISLFKGLFGFPSCVPNVASCIVLIMAQVFSSSTLGPWRHPSSRMLTVLFSTGWLPIRGHMECPCYTS
jgi:hypothetical protein